MTGSPLTILNVAYPFAPVGPDAVGGAEQVLTALDDALVRAGHRSLVVAAEGSRVAGTLVPGPRAGGTVGEATRERVYREHRAALARALARWPVDVVHLHGVDFAAYLPPPGPPALVTLHLPPDWYPPEALAPGRPRTFLHGVSRSQRRCCPPPLARRLWPEIENGVDVAGLAGMRGPKRGFALSLGRVCPEKGYERALAAARRAGLPWILAGQLFPYEAHERYFRETLAPGFDAWRRFVGPVGFRRKRRLLSAARCLVVPSLVPETSSLVAMEALACGTPVVAFPVGALPEIVEHGRTGFLVRDEPEMADAFHAAARLDPEVCQAAARRRFARETMTGRYLDLYRELAGQPADAPETVADPGAAAPLSALAEV